MARTTDKIQAGDGIEYGNGASIVIPQGMTYTRARSVIDAHEAAQSERVASSRTYPFLGDDGAIAAADVIAEMYGLTAGSGWSLPTTRTVTLHDGSTRTVPWDTVSIPALPDVMMDFDVTRDGSFIVSAYGPRRDAGKVTAIMDAIGERLRTASIYRGHAISISRGKAKFLTELAQFNPRAITFSDQVLDVLDAAVWSVIRDVQATEAEGIPVKRAVLLYGPYGTGKTSALMMTAQEAVKAGFTYLHAQVGDDVAEVIRTARRYEPAVIGVEDLDVQGNPSRPTDISALLDAFDGATAKDSRVILLATTNHVDRIHPGMLRPGRLDYTVHVAALDRNGTERLIRAVVPSGKLAADVDFDAVFAVMNGFEPAFAKATVDRAKTWAVRRAGSGYVLTTDDLIGAARSLHDQLALLRAAELQPTEPTLSDALGKVVRAAMTDGSVAFADADGSGYMPYVLAESND